MGKVIHYNKFIQQFSQLSARLTQEGHALQVVKSKVAQRQSCQENWINCLCHPSQWYSSSMPSEPALERTSPNHQIFIGYLPIILRLIYLQLSPVIIQGTTICLSLNVTTTTEDMTMKNESSIVDAEDVIPHPSRGRIVNGEATHISQTPWQMAPPQGS
uniref:Uncharacterized protein n=1 Tax=Romanomermis culicivorax TaxID=13658 RepID=A0A915KMX7_ROMCU